MRPVQISFGDLERADGSCTLSQGQTKVLCAVYGPVEPRNIKQERMDRAFVEVICRPSQGISGPNDRAIEVFIRDIFEQVIMIALHPRTRISIVLQVVHNDGSLLATCINAAWMALMDAGVPLIMKVLALQIVSVEADFTVDPDAQQESLICSGPGARHTIVLAANSNNDFNNIIAWDGVGDFAGTLAYMQSSVAAVTSNSDESEAAAPKYLSLVQSEFSKTYIRRIPVENINN